MTSKGRKKQYKGMKSKERSHSGGFPFANIIGGFITILIGISLMGTISEQVNNAMNCNSTIINDTVNIPQPKGETGSFGGAGGDYHFGGYDGNVSHKSFLSQASVLQTDKSYIGCLGDVTQSAQALLSFVPIFFAIGIIAAAIGTVYTALKSSGQI